MKMLQIDDKSQEASDSNRMAATPSNIVKYALDVTEKYLNGISDAYPARIHNICDVITVVTNNKASIQFMHHEHRCRIAIKHHSPGGLISRNRSMISRIVMVCAYQHDIELRCRPVMWDPYTNPWVILYLIAGYYRIPAALMELHKINKAFCQADMRDADVRVPLCKICKSAVLKSVTKTDVKPISGRFRLVPMYIN